MSESIEPTSPNVEEFSTFDEAATQKGRQETVEPAGLRHSKYRIAPLVDPDEQLRKITDTSALLRFADEKDKLLRNKIEFENDDEAVLLNTDIVIGTPDNPSNWYRYSLCSPEGKNLRVFRNINTPSLVDGYTAPPGSPQAEPGTFVQVSLSELPAQDLTEHRRTAKGGRRVIAGNDTVVGFDIDTLSQRGQAVWIVEKKQAENIDAGVKNDSLLHRLRRRFNQT